MTLWATSHTRAMACWCFASPCHATGSIPAKRFSQRSRSSPPSTNGQKFVEIRTGWQRWHSLQSQQTIEIAQGTKSERALFPCM
ncbi:hypothetical protein EJB05_40405, partial [Eragrostis curvula]